LLIIPQLLKKLIRTHLIGTFPGSGWCLVFYWPQPNLRIDKEMSKRALFIVNLKRRSYFPELN